MNLSLTLFVLFVAPILALPRCVGFYHVWLPNDPGQRERLENLLTTQMEIIANSFAIQYTREMYINIISESESLRLHAQRLAVQYFTLPWLTLTIDQVSTPHTTEVFTINDVNTYCKVTTSPDDLVWYVHDKGAFHDTPGNRKLMPAATMHTLSEGCNDQINSHDADICGLRWVRYPHSHFAGSNMWIARCSYIACLPNVTEATKLRCGKDGPIFPDGRLAARMDPPMAGCGRYASEHWIGLGSEYVQAADCLGYLNEPDGTVRTYFRDYLNLDFDKYGTLCSHAPKPELEVAFDEGRIPDLPGFYTKEKIKMRTETMKLNLAVDAAHFPV
jgi:hypothetical protein